MGAVLDGAAMERPLPPVRRSKHLCADAGYRGRRVLTEITARGYIPHVVGRGAEAKARNGRRRRDPSDDVTIESETALAP